MYGLEFVYNHILRAIGCSSLGILDAYKIEDESVEDINKLLQSYQRQKDLQASTIKRCFELTYQYATAKIANLEKRKLNQKNQNLLKRLKVIQEDCKKMIESFEEKGVK